ncbi:MAG: peroxiredoxin [Notoacmeibacter sp.]|nr:peroxiredoxin [Notoacmeibacter sp.]
MSLRINDLVPNITVETDHGTFALHDFIGNNYAILFSHPKDFTPVCTTEFGAVAQLKDEWGKRGVKVLGISVDNVEEHKKWKSDIEQVAKAPAFFPIVADTDLAMSKAFDMLPADAYLPDGRTPADTATVRSVFIVGPDKKVRLMMTYPMSVGRNFAEVLRALDAVMATDGVPIATPANWRPGEDVIVALSVSTDDAKAKFGDVKVVLPYLRTIKQPNA